MKRFLPPVFLFLIALILRLINLNAIDGRLWINFLSDAYQYQIWAERLLKGTDIAGVFPMGPLYPYLISVIYRVSGSLSHTPILAFQAAIGSVAVLMIYFSTKNVFGEKPAIASGILALLYGPALLYDGLVLSESLQYFLYATLIYLLLKCFSKKEWYFFVMAGIVFGLCILSRASVMIVLPFIFIFYISKKISWSKVFHLSLFTVFGLLTIIPAVEHNMKQGDNVLITSNFGLNFYIGNNEDANSRYMEPKGLSLNEDFTGRRIAEKIQGKSLRPSEVSSFWFQLALSYIRKNPLRFMKMICLKFLRFFEGYEIPQAEDYYYLKRFLPMMKICIIPFWVIAPLGLTAFVATWRRKISSRFLLMFIISYALSIIPFFVLGRYRLLIVPALIIGSGYTLLSLYEGITKKRFQVKNLLLVLLFLCFITLPVLSEDRENDRATAYVNHGLYYIYYGNVSEAEIYFKKALCIDRYHFKALNNLAGVYCSAGRLDDAIRMYRKSIAVNSSQGLPHLNLGIIYLRSGEIDAARAEFETAVSLEPFSLKAIEYLDILSFSKEAASYEVASRFSAMGKYSEAIFFYEEALKQDPHDLRIYNNFGYALQTVGQYDRAIMVYEECIKLFPNEVIPLNNLASIYYKMGDIEKAKELWNKCLDIDPQQPNVQSNLKVLLEKKK